MELLQLLWKDGRFKWFPEDALEVLDGCFDLRLERLSAGETRESHGQIGYILQGRAVLRQGDGVIAAANGTLFGVVRAEDGRKRAEQTILTAETACDILWFDLDLLCSVCYRACWFHARMLKELEQLF